jgi:hypothetical protein
VKCSAKRELGQKSKSYEKASTIFFFSQLGALSHSKAMETLGKDTESDRSDRSELG